MAKTHHAILRDNTILNTSVLANEEGNLEKIKALRDQLELYIHSFSPKTTSERFFTSASERAFIHFIKDLHQRATSYIAVAEHLAVVERVPAMGV